MLNRQTRCFSIILALIMMLSAVGTAAAEQEKRIMGNPGDADEWIAAFLGEHPEELEGQWAMSAQMEAAAAQMGGIAGLAKQMAALGKVMEIRPAYEGEIQKNKAFYIPCVFASMAVDWLGMPKDSMPFYSSDEKWSKKGGYIIDFILVSGNFGHNRDTSYYKHKWRIMRKTGSFMRKVSDIFRHAYVFPNSIGFIPCIMYNGVKAAIRGE